MSFEIERRFLVKKIPPEFRIMERQGIPVIQGYLVGENVRFRRYGEKCYRTIKSGHGLRREENEEEITLEEFDVVWPRTMGTRLTKTRYLLDNGDYVFELDVFHGRLRYLRIIEVEFKSVDEALAFEPPAWFGEEVTNKPEYSNFFLALNGLLKKEGVNVRTN